MVDALAFDDLDLYGRELDDPVAELEQDVVHMLLETFGSNPDDTLRGIGLEDALSGPADPTLRHRIATRLQDDDRITSADVTMTQADSGNTRIDIAIQFNEETLGIAVEVDGNGNVTRATS